MGNTDFAVYEDGLHHISLKLIDPNPFNKRSGIDYKDDQLRELADSIAAVGVQQPAVARPHNGRIQLIMGERRFRASKLAGKDSLPVIIKNNIDDRLAVELCIIENLQRKDVHALDEANGYKALIEMGDPKAQYDVAAIAKKVGKSGSYVYQRLKLAELIPAAQKQFRDGFLTAAHAVDIARLASDDQEKALAFCLNLYGRKRDQAPTFRELREWIQESILLNLDKAPFDIADENLVAGVPACTDCPKRTGSNPMLFAGMGGNNCTDSVCYGSKKAAVVIVNVARIEESVGVKPILISHRFDKTDKEIADSPKEIQKGIVFSKDYKAHTYDFTVGKQVGIEKDSCKYTKLAVFVDNAGTRNTDRKKPGESTYVCTDPKCLIHRDKHSSQQSSGSQTSDKYKRDLKVAKEYRSSLFVAIAEKAKQPTRADRELIACKFFDMAYRGGSNFPELLGWDKKIAEFGGQKKLEQKIGSLSNAELDSLLLLLACSDDLESFRSPNKPKVLETVARRHHIVPEKILSAARQKFAKKPDEKKSKVKPISKAKPVKARKVIDLTKKTARKKAGKKRSK